MITVSKTGAGVYCDACKRVDLNQTDCGVQLSADAQPPQRIYLCGRCSRALIGALCVLRDNDPAKQCLVGNVA